VSNNKVILDPSSWVIDENNKINLRYRILTDDLNIRSAFSPTYSIDAPAILGPEGVFTQVDRTITSETSGGTTTIRLAWTTSPQYNNMKYFVFLNDEYLQTTNVSLFNYSTTVSGTYNFTVQFPTTKKAILTNAVLFTASITI